MRNEELGMRNLCSFYCCCFLVEGGLHLKNILCMMDVSLIFEFFCVNFSADFVWIGRNAK